MEPVLYDITDAARYLGVSPSTLRYWEREGLVRAGRNRGNDYRQYALHDLIDASEIAFYRRLGVPVRELAGYRTLSARDLDDALDRTARDVEQRIAELEAQHAERLSAAEQERKRLLSELDELRPQVEEYGRVKAHIADIELSARERADALDAATRERLQAMIAACRGHCEQVLSTLGATCESVSNELKRADAAVAQLPEAFTTLEGQLDELKKLEQ